VYGVAYLDIEIVVFWPVTLPCPSSGWEWKQIGLFKTLVSYCNITRCQNKEDREKMSSSPWKSQISHTYSF